MLDAEAYPAAELAERYLGRWHVEVHLRDLKQTLGMDVLKCKTAWSADCWRKSSSVVARSGSRVADGVSMGWKRNEASKPS